MPLSSIAEAILKPIVECIAEVVIQVMGYFTARIVIPSLTLGWMRVEPLRTASHTRTYRCYRDARGRMLMGSDLAILTGFLFWCLTGLAIFLLY